MRNAKITLANGYHNTQTKITVPEFILAHPTPMLAAWELVQKNKHYKSGAGPDYARLDKRIRKALCGSADCKCGIVRG